MAQVNPVEYIKNSSTAGFAAAGEKKEINKTTAAPIQKDANQGNTKPLDKGQQMYLDKVVNPDEVDYTNEEQKKVGANQIDTKGEDGQDVSEKDDGKGAAATGVGAGAAAAGAGIAAAIIGAKTTTKKKKAESITCFVLSCIALVSCTVAFALSFPSIFDKNIDDRKAKTSKAEEIDNKMQEFIDTLATDNENMATNIQNYEDVSNSKVETFETNMNEITVLTCEMQEAALNGDAKAVEQKQQRIDELKQAQTDDSLESECESIRDGMAEYESHNNEAVGVAESGDKVAKFLQAGKPFEKMAQALSILAYAGAAAMLIPVTLAIVAAGKDAAKIVTIWKAPFGIAAAAIFGVCAGLLAGTGINMGKAKDAEGAAADAGNTMAGYVTNLNTGVQDQASTQTGTVAVYDDTDTESETAIEQSQQESDEITQENEKQLQKEMASGDTVTPEDTNKPEPEPETNAA